MIAMASHSELYMWACEYGRKTLANATDSFSTHASASFDGWPATITLDLRLFICIVGGLALIL
eukprot:SAG11_NODE_8438_length_1015_cov_1.516376_1_plen_62_part_10